MLRVLLYLWVVPVSILGLLVASIGRASGGSLSVVNGVIEAAGGWPARIMRRGLPFSGAVTALTLGHVVIGISRSALRATRAHERAHVRQFERWGLFLLVAYPLAGAFVWLRGRHPYYDNPFEREARAAENERALPG